MSYNSRVIGKVGNVLKLTIAEKGCPRLGPVDRHTCPRSGLGTEQFAPSAGCSLPHAPLLSHHETILSFPSLVAHRTAETHTHSADGLIPLPGQLAAFPVIVIVELVTRDPGDRQQVEWAPAQWSAELISRRSSVLAASTT